jgi:hypothetical protein
MHNLSDPRHIGVSRAEFEARAKGIPTRGHQLDLARDVAVERFTHFTGHERDVLLGYLKGRAERPAAN